jgi:membrane peptidoglycan carboxypeptidase
LNRGKISRPHLLREIRDPITNRLIRRMEPQIVNEVPVSPSSLHTIQEGLRAVVSRGTARRLQMYAVPIAGKTGTAQTRSRVQGRSHAWFVGYAPHGAPPEETVVVAVFVEYGMGGGMAAAPVAGEMLNAAFPDWTPQKTRELEERRRVEAARFEPSALEPADGEATGPRANSSATDGNIGGDVYLPDADAPRTAPAIQNTMPPGFVPGQRSQAPDEREPESKEQRLPIKREEPGRAPASRLSL